MPTPVETLLVYRRPVLINRLSVRYGLPVSTAHGLPAFKDQSLTVTRAHETPR